MIRLLSAIVLLPLVVGAVWFLPPWCTLLLAEIAAVLACFEYLALARALGANVPRLLTSIAVVAACAAVAVAVPPLELVLMAALVLLGLLAVASGRPGTASLVDAAASIFPIVYIALPLGAIAAVRTLGGREAVLLLMMTIVVSDSA